jgi:tRNA (guanine37-N1)-methyltransferase
MKIDILTIFPSMVVGPLQESILGRAQKNKLVSITVHDLRKYTLDKHRSVDTKPYGGGPGMVMRVEVIDRAIKDLKTKESKVILLTPQGKVFKQTMASKLSKEKHLVLICGHYEGFDERIRKLVNEEISIGDYVLTGGELPAMVVVDAAVRLLPGVVGNAESIKSESFAKNRLEYPQYTRPDDYQGMKVPEVLLKGNHKEIEKWRNEQSEMRTKKRRSDLITKIDLKPL